MTPTSSQQITDRQPAPGALPTVSDAPDETPRQHPHRKRRKPHPAHQPRRRLSTLPLTARITLFLIGWLFVLFGIVGALLPVLQGWVPLMIGAAVLSLVSEAAYSLIRWFMRRWPLSRWPNFARKIEALRIRWHRRLHRRFRRKG